MTEIPRRRKVLHSLNAQVMGAESLQALTKPMAWDEHLDKSASIYETCIKEVYVKYRTSTGKLAVNYEELEAVYLKV